MTPGEWRVVDYSGGKSGGYIEIRGPNGEAVLTMFPLAGNGGVGVEAALANAEFIVAARARQEMEDMERIHAEQDARDVA